MCSQTVRTLLVIVFILLAQVCTLAAEDANPLYQQAYELEKKEKFTEALTLYQRVITEFGEDYFAGPDKAGFRIKYLTCKAALENGDITGARNLADQIRNLASSSKKKPGQLYLMGRLFEKKVLIADALPFYQQVVAEYPNVPESGPDKAGFRTKYLTCKMALEDGDIAEARSLADQIRNLESSPKKKPGQLYLTGRLFEKKVLFPEALSFYQQLVSEYPDSFFAGPDRAGFRTKFISCRLALKTGDIDTAKEIAEQIRILACSPEIKTEQLCMIGHLFASKSLLIAGGDGDLVEKMLNICDSFYKEVIESGKSDDVHFKQAQIGEDVVKTLRFINHGDIKSAVESTAQIKVQYAGSNRLVKTLFVIGEGYCIKGLSGGRQEFFRESVKLFENDISSANLTASAYYMLGLCYQQLEDYTKAAKSFQSAYQADPKNKHADYCLFSVGNCYKKLLEEGVVSQAEAKPVIEAIYSQLISEFPQYDYASHLKEYEYSVSEPNDI